MAYGGLPFADNGCPVPYVYIYYVSDMIDISETVYNLIHLPWMLSSTDILF